MLMLANIAEISAVVSLLACPSAQFKIFLYRKLIFCYMLQTTLENSSQDDVICNLSVRLANGTPTDQC